MKAIQLLVNSQLPPDLRDYNRELDSKSIGALMADIARKYPDQYERISKSISDIGRKASYFQGETLTLNDNRPVIDRDRILNEMEDELAAASKATPDRNEYDKQKLTIWEKFNNRIQKETSQQALAKHNNLAYSVVSGARGKPPQLKMMLSTPGLYTDAQDNVIPLFIKHSFAEGLRPAEYLAGTYGARKSVLCLQEDTLVRMADFSCKPIKSIDAGMFVMGADKEGNTFPVRVIRKYNQGLQPVNRYSFKRGVSEGRHEVVCTENHAILMNDVKTYHRSYMEARKYGGKFPDKSLLHDKTIIPIGQGTKKRAAVLAGACTGVGGVEERYALLLGLLTGDGSVCNEDLRLRLSCADERMITDIQPYVASLGLKVSDRRTESNYDWEIVCADYSASRNVSIQKGIQGFVKDARMEHKQILIQEGLAWHRAETKTLPTNINIWNNKSVLAYISGILATDGSIYFDSKSGKPAISFAMTAKDVIFGLCDILRTRFGVYSSEISYRTKGGFGDTNSVRKNVLWEFSITADYAVKQLLNLLPAIPGIKEDIRRQAKLFELKQCNPYPKARISTIQYIGMEPCFDIEVEHEDHLFVLESGIVVSNSTKRATAKGGDLAKQMVQNTAKIVVGETDCGAMNGLNLDINDKSLRGRVLAMDIGGAKAGTVLDKSAIAHLRNKGTTQLIARSPMTCQAKEGVCAKCMGLDSSGKFPSRGDSVGITAAQAIGEPITQNALNCVGENTMVLMADYAEKRIRDIVPGDMVMGSDVLGNISPTKVTHVWDQGMQPVQRRVYKMGQTKQRLYLESTEAHPVLSNRKTFGITNGKNNDILEKLVAGFAHKNLAAALPVHNNTAGVDEPWAVFVGAYLGDGIRWDSEANGHVTFSCADETEINDINALLRDLNIKLVKCTRSHDWRAVMIEDDISDYRDTTGQVVGGFRSAVRNKLVELELDNKYAHNKRVPACVWTWSAISVADLIAGFIATDGSVYKNKDGHVGISFSSCSKEMLIDLKRLLQFKLCVYSSALTLVGKAGSGNRIHDQWQFTITRFDQIKRLYGFIQNRVPGIKKKRIEEYVSNAAYQLRNPDWFYRARRDNGKQEDLGMRHCYDITVAHPDHLFVLANGLIVSNTKHQGGAASSKKEYSGFATINQFMQTPDTFPDKAILAKKDGNVTSVVEAPQGGYYVSVDNEPHYVSPGFQVHVKVGDKVEAGDELSEGLADPGEVVELRGLGAGRKYYSDRLKRLLDDSGMEADPRNTELLARAALDHLELDDPGDDSPYLPDDVVSYSSFSNTYTPPADTAKTPTLKAVGAYLQSPALHFTIGTRVTPKVAKDLDDAGFKEVFSSTKPPPFKSSMVRLRAATHSGDDWLASLHTSYLKKQLNESAIRGDDSNVESNSHFAPRLAIGKDFGQNIQSTGKF